MMVRRRLKDLGIFKSGLTYSPEDICDEDKGVLVLRSSNIQDGKLVFNNNVYVDMDLHEKMLVSKGDILICSRNGSASLVGKTAIIDRDVKASWGAFMMLFRTIYDSSYMNYLLNVSITKSKGLFSTSTINQLTNSMLGDIFVDVFDTKEEQEQIGEYLDAKCGDIDNRIAVLEKEQKAYERLKIAVINRAVTEGLDPEIPKRDSGLDWLGMIPEHWEVKRLKDLGYLYSGLTGKAGDDFRCDDESLTKPYVPFTNILNNTRVSKDLLHRVVMSENEDQNKVRKGDLLFLMSSEDYESIAKSAVVSEDLGEVYLNSFCRGFRPNTPEIVSEFVNYQLYAIKYRDNLRFEARGFTRINIKIDKISSMTVTLPPYSEQKAIVEYLDTKCATIDAKIGNIAKRIEAYKRLKRALINEVVTGKRAV